MFFFSFFLLVLDREQTKIQRKQFDPLQVYSYHVWTMIKSLLLSSSLKSLSTYDSVSTKQEDIFTYRQLPSAVRFLGIKGLIKRKKMHRWYKIMIPKIAYSEKLWNYLRQYLTATNKRLFVHTPTSLVIRIGNTWWMFLLITVVLPLLLCHLSVLHLQL